MFWSNFGQKTLLPPALQCATSEARPSIVLGHCQKHTCAGQSRLIRSALLAIGSLLGTWRTSVTVAALRGTTAKRTI